MPSIEIEVQTAATWMNADDVDRFLTAVDDFKGMRERHARTDIAKFHRRIGTEERRTDITGARRCQGRGQVAPRPVSRGACCLPYRQPSLLKRRRDTLGTGRKQGQHRSAHFKSRHAICEMVSKVPPHRRAIQWWQFLTGLITQTEDTPCWRRPRPAKRRRCRKAGVRGGRHRVALYGLSRFSVGGLLAAAAGAAFVYRGAHGALSHVGALGLTSVEPPAPATSVPAGRGVKVEKSIHVNRPAADLYRYWRAG